MKQVEIFAIGLFNKYSMMKHGRTYDWNYLSKERRLEWMKEVVVYLKFIISKVKEQLKPAPAVIPGEASYGVGFKNGLQTKHVETLILLEALEADICKQLDEIVDQKG